MPASGHTIRTAGPEDIPALMRIRAAVRENVLSDPSKAPAASYKDFIERSRIWVWEEGGRVLGFCAADPVAGSIWALFIDPRAEGRGIGRSLLPYALDDLKRDGWTKARLVTEPGSRAEQFYRRGGWVETGTSPHGELCFEKRL